MNVTEDGDTDMILTYIYLTTGRKRFLYFCKDIVKVYLLDGEDETKLTFDRHFNKEEYQCS